MSSMVTYGLKRFISFIIDYALFFLLLEHIYFSLVDKEKMAYMK